jgi:hypothetical protein
MDNETLNKFLKERKDILLKELEAIDVLLVAVDSKDVYSDIVNILIESAVATPQGSIAIDTKVIEPKEIDFTVGMKHSKTKWYGGGRMIPIVRKPEKCTWKEYLVEVIKRLDGKGKTNEIAEVMINSVNDLSFVKARQIAADLLPELVEEGLLNVEKGNSKKEGHTYMLKEYKLNKVKDYIKQLSIQKDA